MTKELLRSGLISVPLATRPKSDELPKYLVAFQFHIIDLSLRLIEDENLKRSNVLPNDLTATLQRLVTSLSTDLEYIRIPVVWAMCNKLVHTIDPIKDRLIADQRSNFEELTDTVGILLSHFDLAQHLTDAEKRVAGGDDTIDEALFVELNELVHEFDESRARIFTNAAERTNRIGAVLALPRGIVPQVTVVSYKFFKLFSKFLDRSFKIVFASVGAVFGLFSSAVVMGLHETTVVQILLEWIGRLL